MLMMFHAPRSHRSRLFLVFATLLVAGLGTLLLSS